ncbi:hypothetical protein MBGDF03_01083 [Thermoplasmatales archaeon SCGC AB-540-F20]|nr:hypothetical protein MBGDF03_01083 [Thermoplasmatales archaeon SCGC AB-540-F20]
MPKSSKKQISEDEKKIIAEMQNNSGDSIENIAKKMWFFQTEDMENQKKIGKKQNNLGILCNSR